MKDIYIFGAGQTGVKIYNEIKEDGLNILGFLDNNPLKHNTKIQGLEVFGDASYLENKQFSKIIIGSLAGYRIIKEELKNKGVAEEKIDISYVQYSSRAREQFLIDYAKIWGDVPADIAEGGVFQGEFAKLLNSQFSNDKLYLFDTFEGFDERDLVTEYKNKYSQEIGGHFQTTDVQLVMDKMVKAENVIIKKGYFPETTFGLEDNKYKFVNLDFDLYDPILAGLNYFYPRMLPGSIILVHDYFSDGFRGVKEAVSKFKETEPNLLTMPIGDGWSLGIIKSFS